MKRIFFISASVIILIIVFIFLFREKNVVQNPLPIDNSVQPEIAPQTFTPLIISSSPIGAYVFLDGKEMGVTPLTVTNLSQAIHQLVLRKSGFEETAATFSPSNTTNIINLSLAPLLTVSTPSPSAIVVENTETPTITNETEIENVLSDLANNDPQIPSELAGQVNVPTGYRFPLNSDLTNLITLEIIPPPLTQDSTTKRMPVIEKNELLAKLRFGYRYNPLTQDIEPIQLALTNLINFGYFEPSSHSVAADSFVTWFNQSPTTCALRTDPKSPQKINQNILSQNSATIQLKEKGIYIFFCQVNPGPIQTISVS